MIPDLLQCFLDHFWNCQQIDWIWTREPCIHHQNIPKHRRRIWEHPWTYYWSYLRIWESENVGRSRNRFFFIENLEYLMLYQFSKDGHQKWWRTPQTLLQKHGYEIHRTFYFQARESPAPLNIPIPTLAPDPGVKIVFSNVKIVSFSVI